ncbi:MbeB family mobilization protein [Klebsiella quasipneumoniae]|uniref:MbeB family mobilization protein n=3 Tax=Enterobacteriaceae TaxID=543 RepID=UPI001E5697DB|nr:MbeB family mobilization protein [Klebsiella quasipneumoniae]MCD7091382.1 MbeB family mobilization protein [Klebsiella quasipneumoniae subsp. quasipneumoniae]
MSEISRLATAFEKRSTEQAENTEKAVSSAFEKHESALLEALSTSEKRTREAIEGQYQRLQQVALKSWIAVTLPVMLVIILAVGISVLMGMYIKHQAEEIREQSATLQTLKDQGGAMTLTHCGSSRRLCAKIDKSATAYGENGEYRILAGY